MQSTTCSTIMQPHTYSCRTSMVMVTRTNGCVVVLEAACSVALCPTRSEVDGSIGASMSRAIAAVEIRGSVTEVAVLVVVGFFSLVVVVGSVLVDGSVLEVVVVV